MRVETGLRVEDVRQSARHTLFVEGDSSDGLDPTVLRELLPVKVRVQAIGPSHELRAAARAMVREHPNYYFLIDRDDLRAEAAEDSWRRFPDAMGNLLIWRRRELENYFLIPEYLEKSGFLRGTREELRATILSACRERVYLDAANLAIIETRAMLRTTGIEVLDGPLRTRDAAREALLAMPEFGACARDVQQRLSRERIEELFGAFVQEITGGADPIEWDAGRWASLIKGKAVFGTVVSRCFQVRTERGAILQGAQARRLLALELVRLPLDQQPDDFRELHQRMSGIVDAE